MQLYIYYKYEAENLWQQPSAAAAACHVLESGWSWSFEVELNYFRIRVGDGHRHGNGGWGWCWRCHTASCAFYLSWFYWNLFPQFRLFVHLSVSLSDLTGSEWNMAFARILLKISQREKNDRVTGMVGGRWSNGRLLQIVEQGVGLANCIPIELLPASVAYRFLVSRKTHAPFNWTAPMWRKICPLD